MNACSIQAGGTIFSFNLTMTKLRTLKDFSTVPLNTNQAECLLMLFSQSDDKVKIPFTEVIAKELGFLPQVFQKRLEFHGVNVDVGLALFLLTSAIDTPGHAVMWVWTLFNFEQRKDDNHKMLSLEDWAANFPLGIPSKEAYDEAWEDQKDKVRSNALDNADTWA